MRNRFNLLLQSDRGWNYFFRQITSCWDPIGWTRNRVALRKLEIQSGGLSWRNSSTWEITRAITVYSNHPQFRTPSPPNLIRFHDSYSSPKSQIILMNFDLQDQLEFLIGLNDIAPNSRSGMNDTKMIPPFEVVKAINRIHHFKIIRLHTSMNPMSVSARIPISDTSQSLSHRFSAFEFRTPFLGSDVLWLWHWILMQTAPSVRHSER